MRLTVAAPLLAAAVAGCGADAFYEITTPAPAVRLPLDEALHSYGAEWWYYTGRVTTEDGQGYGVEAVIFHDAHLPLLILTEAWAAHFAVLEEASGSFTYDQTRSTGGVSINAPRGVGFDLHTPRVQMTGSDGHDHVQAAMSNGRYAVDLILEDERGPVFHGGVGYVPYGAYGQSFYYSRPRMRASGTLQIDGAPHHVTGEFWFDRQWGHDLNNPWLGWDWFSLRLDDGSSVMLFVFRDANPVVALGTYIPPSGEPTELTSEDFVITPTTFWISPRTGGTYPVGWEIELPSLDLTLTVTAVADDQELDARSTTLNVYWEGLCRITGTRSGASVGGLAYVELANYVR